MSFDATFVHWREWNHTIQLCFCLETHISCVRTFAKTLIQIVSLAQTGIKTLFVIMFTGRSEPQS